MFAYSALLAPCARNALAFSSRSYIRPLSTAVINSNIYPSQTTRTNLMASTQTINSNMNLALLNRQFQTSAITRDIDSAAKYIGAGAATVGVAGSENPTMFPSQPACSQSTAPGHVWPPTNLFLLLCPVCVTCSFVHLLWRCWYRIGIWIAHHRLRQKSISKTATFLVRHLRFRLVRSHGSVLFDDVLLTSFRLLSYLHLVCQEQGQQQWFRSNTAG